MSQSLAQIYLHIVWSTKLRAPHLQDRELRNAMFAYLAGICQRHDSPAVIVGGHVDHVHVLCRLGKMMRPADLLRELKRDSSKWVKEPSRLVSDFEWQAGYGAFSVSPGHVDQLKTYIANQDEHHRSESFQDEFRRLLRLYGLEYDERYVWD